MAPVTGTAATELPLMPDPWPRCGQGNTVGAMGTCAGAPVCRYREDGGDWRYRCAAHDPTRQPWWATSELAGFEYETAVPWPAPPVRLFTLEVTPAMLACADCKQTVAGPIVPGAAFTLGPHDCPARAGTP